MNAESSAPAVLIGPSTGTGSLYCVESDFGGFVSVWGFILVASVGIALCLEGRSVELFSGMLLSIGVCKRIAKNVITIRIMIGVVM